MPQNSIDLNSGHVCRETPEDFVTSTPTILIELKHSRRRDFYTKSKMSLISLISYIFGGVQHHMLFLWSLNSCLEFWTADLSPSSSPSSGLMSHPAPPLYPSIAAGPCTSSFILIVFTFSSERPATAADRCAFHTLFVSLFCHSRQRQQSSLITSDPHAACFCLPRLHFSPTCWQCYPVTSLWRTKDWEQTRQMGNQTQTSRCAWWYNEPEWTGRILIWW